MTIRGSEQRRAKKVAIVMVGFRCAPVTAPKLNMNRVRKTKLLMPPTRGPMNAALSKGPNCAVGGVGRISGEEPE